MIVFDYVQCRWLVACLCFCPMWMTVENKLALLMYFAVKSGMKPVVSAMQSAVWCRSFVLPYSLRATGCGLIRFLF